MRRRLLNLLMLVSCGALLTGMAFQIMPRDIPSLNSTAKVSLEPPGKAKRGKTITMQVKVDMTGVTAPGTSQPAALGSYVIPISFDRNVLRFVSASGGETSAFASGPATMTNVQTANTNGLVTLVGSQIVSDTPAGVVGVASVSFTVIALEKGNTTVGVNAQLSAPSLSLASPTPSGMVSEPYRIAAAGQSSALKIK